MSMGLGAIYLYHSSLKGKTLSYLLLTCAAQLKVYPLIFIFGLFDSKKTWKKNFVQQTFFLIINFLLFFALGFDKAKHFFYTMFNKMGGGSYNREVNMSLSCYFSLATSVLDKITGHSFMIIQSFKIIILLFLGGSFCYLVWKIYTGKLKGLSADYILASTILTLLLPGVSHDYKLSYLAGPFVFYIYKNHKRINNYVLYILYFLFCSTLWHFWDHKQGAFLLNILFKVNTPALVTIYFIVIFLNVRSRPEVKSN
jgi:hypothetical protein